MKKIRLLALLLALLMLPLGTLFSCKPDDVPDDPDDDDEQEEPENPDTGDVNIDNDGTRSGYLVFFTFDAAKRGNIPSESQPYSTFLNFPVKDGGSYVIDKKFGSTTDGTLLIHREQGKKTDPYMDLKVDGAVEGLFSEHMVQFKVRFEDGLFGSEAKVYGRKGGSTSITQDFIVFGNGYIKDCAGNVIYGDDPDDKRGWITVSLLIDDQNGVYDIYIDGIKKTNKLAYTSNSYPLWESELPGLYRFSITSSTDAETFFYIDDVCIMNGDEETTGVYEGSDISYIDTYTKYFDVIKKDRESVLSLYTDTTKGKMKNSVFSSALLMSNIICLSKITDAGEGNYDIVDLQQDYGVETGSYSTTSILYKDNTYFSVDVDGNITYHPDKTAEGGEIKGTWTAEGAVVKFTWTDGIAPKYGELDILSATYAETTLTLCSDENGGEPIADAAFELFVPAAYGTSTYVDSEGAQAFAFDTFKQTVSFNNFNAGSGTVTGVYPYEDVDGNITVQCEPAVTLVYDAENNKFIFGETEFTKAVEELPENMLGSNDTLAIKFSNFKSGQTQLLLPVDNEWWQSFSQRSTTIEFVFYADQKMVDDNFRFMLLFDCADSDEGWSYYSTVFAATTDNRYKAGWNTFTINIPTIGSSRSPDLSKLYSIQINTTGWSNGIPDTRDDGTTYYDVGDDGYTFYIARLAFVESAFVPVQGPSAEHADCKHEDENGNDLFVEVSEPIPSNCLIGSYYIKQCSVCGATQLDKSKPIGEPTGHTLSEREEYRNPTCTEEGYYYKVCTLCGEEVIVGDPIPATGHKFYDIVDWSTKTKTTTCQLCGYTETTVIFEEMLSLSEKISYLGLATDHKQAVYVESGHNDDYKLGSLNNDKPPETALDTLLKINPKNATFNAVKINDNQYAFEYKRGTTPTVDNYLDLEINDKVPAGTNLVIEFDIMLGSKGANDVYAKLDSTFKDRNGGKVDVPTFSISDAGVLSLTNDSSVSVQLSAAKFTNIALCFKVDTNEISLYADGVFVGTAKWAGSTDVSMNFLANDYRISYTKTANESGASHFFNNFLYYEGDAPVCVLSSTDVKEEYVGDIKLQDELNNDMLFPFEVGYANVDAKLPAAVYTSQYIMQFKVTGKDLKDGVLIEGYKLKNGVNYYQALLEIKDGKLYCMGELISTSTENFLVTFIANDANGNISVMINGELIPGGAIDYTNDLYADNTASFRGLIFRNDCGRYTVSDFEMYTGNTLKTAE